jgi:hypothetical protein
MRTHNTFVNTVAVRMEQVDQICFKVSPSHAYASFDVCSNLIANIHANPGGAFVSKMVAEVADPIRQNNSH